MDTITFADVLFTIITLAVTFTILYFVNKAKNKNKQTGSDSSASVSEDANKSDVVS